MARKKDSSELEYLRGIIRKQEAQLRELKKELAKTKPTVIFKEEKPKEKLQRVDEQEICPKCKTDLKTINLGIKKFLVCQSSSCSFKKLTN